MKYYIWKKIRNIHEKDQFFEKVDRNQYIDLRTGVQWYLRDDWLVSISEEKMVARML